MCSNAYCNQLFTYDENLIDGSMRVTVKFIKPNGVEHEGLVKMLDPFIHTKTPFVKDYNKHYRVWQKYNVHNAHKGIRVPMVQTSTRSLNLSSISSQISVLASSTIAANSSPPIL